MTVNVFENFKLNMLNMTSHIEYDKFQISNNAQSDE